MHKNEGNAHLRYVRQFYVISSHSHHILIHSPCQTTKMKMCPKVSIALLTTHIMHPHRPSTPHSLQPRQSATFESKFSGLFKIFLTSSLY